MQGTEVSVSQYATHPEMRLYFFVQDEVHAILRATVDLLTLQLGAIEGIETVDVIADSNLLVVTSENNRGWEEIDKEIADILRNSLNISPRFIYRRS